MRYNDARKTSQPHRNAQIQENPYLQYFVGLAGYQMKASFAPSLFVEIRKRMGRGVFEIFQGAIIDVLEDAKAKKKSPSQIKQSRSEQPPEDRGDPPSSSGGTSQEEEPDHRGKLILDATVTPQAIRYPTDLSLLSA